MHNKTCIKYLSTGEAKNIDLTSINTLHGASVTVRPCALFIAVANANYTGYGSRFESKGMSKSTRELLSVEQTHLLYVCHDVSIEFGISFFTRSYKVHCTNVDTLKLRSNSVGDLIFKDNIYRRT